MRSIARALLTCSLAAMAACGKREEPPPAPPPKPTSSWTAADSEAVAKDLVDSAVHQEWVIAFKTHNDRAPKLQIGSIEDRSGDHVDVERLAADLEEQFIATQQVAFAAGKGADFILSGSIGREVLPGRDQARYQVDVRLITPEGDPVWISGIERTVALKDVAAPAQ